jgi:hypothetical protein
VTVHLQERIVLTFLLPFHLPQNSSSTLKTNQQQDSEKTTLSHRPKMEAYNERLHRLDNLVEAQWDDAMEELNRRRTARIEYEAKSSDIRSRTIGISSPKRSSPPKPSSQSPLQLSSQSSLRGTTSSPHFPRNSTSPSENELQRALQQVNIVFDRVQAPASLSPAPPPLLSSSFLSLRPSQQQQQQRLSSRQLQLRIHTPPEDRRISFASTAPRDHPTTPHTTPHPSGTEGRGGGRGGGGDHRTSRTASSRASSVSGSSQFLTSSLSDDQIYNVASAAAEGNILHT